MIESQCIDIALKENIEEKLYIEAVCTHGNDSATAIISGGHTNFVYISRNQDVLLDNRTPASAEAQAAHVELTLRKVFDFATTAPLEEIEFILEARRLNKNAAERSFQGKYGHELGRMLRNSQTERNIMGNNTFTHILSYTSAACDARMAGAMIPVMSNSGSGNQGIAATLPVVVYAEDNHNSEEELTRALILSHLTAIYIKQSLGRLSALCGCVVAATGSSCGITYLMGGGYQQVMYAVQKHDRHTYRHDLRWSQTKLRTEVDKWSFNCCYVCHHGDGTEMCNCRRRYHRRKRKSEYTQSYQDRFGRNERNRQACIRYYDP